MATIRERNRRFTAMVRKAGRGSVSKSFSTRRAAEKWARHTEVTIEKGELPEVTPHTLADAIDRYLEHPDKDLSKHDRKIRAWWRDELGNRRLDRLRREDFASAREKLRNVTSRYGEPLSAATVNRGLHAVSAVLTGVIE